MGRGDQKKKKKESDKTKNKMADKNPTISMITLNVSELSNIIKRHKLFYWIKKKQDPTIHCL